MIGGGGNAEVAKFDAKTWNDTVQQLDQVTKILETWVESADEPKLQAAAQVYTNISTHNAYHIGQIIFVRDQPRAMSELQLRWFHMRTR